MLISTLLLATTVSAKNYFNAHDDMCEGTRVHQCKNDYNSIRNLQITLNKDKKIKANIKEDGKWGENTKSAVVAFQEAYALKNTDGWVGKNTKLELDKISSNIKFPKDVKVKVKSQSNSYTHYKTYKEFKNNTNLKKSFSVFKDSGLLKKSTGSNTKLTIDISEQRVKLIVDGKIALSSPCTTGAKRKLEPNTKVIRDQSTPKGIFKITEKISDKRSTIFGKFYRNGKVVYKGDRRKYKGPKAEYKGASLKNWMRLTSGGIGLHASKYVKRYPGSNGCIRLPYKVSKTIFKSVRRGTKVSIVN
jgi:lipoprotein-anchoring transpeptidase ErfK/SrfK